MGSVPFALSVHKFISSVGADAGFAALIAVALLVLLYFAHARETAGLRAHIQQLLERVAELETALARVAANQARVAPAPPPAGFRPPVRVGAAGANAGAAVAQVGAAGRGPAVPVGASAALRLAALELPPGPPAGMAAPALSSATRVIPAAVAARIAAARVAVAAGGGGIGIGGDEPLEAAAELAGTPTALAPVPTAPSPSTAAAGQGQAPAGSNGASGPPPAAAPAPVAPGPTPAPAPARAATGPAGPRPPAGRPAPAGAVGRPNSAAASRRPARTSYLEQDRTEARLHVPRAFLVGLAVVIVAGIVVVAVVLSQSSGGSHSPSSSTSRAGAANATRHTRVAATATVNPANVTVAVLNGTTILRLAHRVAAKLVPPFRKGKVGDASQPGLTTTIVSYLPGHRAAALVVARRLGLSAAAVRAVDPDTETVACSGAVPCATDVVVTVGTDLSNL